MILGVAVYGNTVTQALIPTRWLPPLAMLLALALGLMIWTGTADARLDGGVSLGDGAYSPIVFDAFDHWLTPSAAQPSYPGGTLGGLFNRGGLIGGFAAGFLGSGVIGLLFGHGLIGELGGMASVLGLVFQLALIALLARLIWTWWRVDKTPVAANLSPRQLADAYGHTRHEALPDVDHGAGAAAGAPQPGALAKTEPSGR